MHQVKVNQLWLQLVVCLTESCRNCDIHAAHISIHMLTKMLIIKFVLILFPVPILATLSLPTLFLFELKITILLSSCNNTH